MAQIETLSPVNIKTVDNFIASPAGINGVAVLNNAGSTYIQVYETMTGVENDFDPSSAIYAQAETYFSGDGSLFAVINYGPDAVQSTTTSTTSSSAGSSAGSSSASSAGSSSAGSSSASSSSASTPSESAQAIGALTKYWSAGWTYVYMLATDSNHQLILDVANFIELQEERLTVIDVPTTTDTPDLSWIAPLAQVQSAIKLSLKYYSGYQFGMSVIANLTSNDAGTDPTFLTFSTNVVPQDKYNFDLQKQEHYYGKYNVATYAFRGGMYALTDQHTSGATQISTMTIREQITYSVYEATYNIFVSNQGHIPYDQTGADLFTSAIKAVLKGATDNQWIDPQTQSVTPVDVNKISLAKKASGELDGIKWSWTPIDSIDKVVFTQTINLPVV